MANLKEIRSRITSVNSTMQITNAMKMVSAAKLKRAQDAITAMRPYSEKLTELLQHLSATLDPEADGGVYSEQRDPKNILIVSITSNRGLAGAFNSNVIREVRQLAEEKYAAQKVDFLTIGKKGDDTLKKLGTIVANNNDILDDTTFENSSEIAENLMDLFVSKKYDKILLVYNSFRNAATQVVITEDFLPILPAQNTTGQPEESSYLFEPSKEEIIETLIPKSLKTQLFKAIRDSVASEHGARMTAMHKATDNAEELSEELTLQYNKARQASITNEILEIVGGAEALAG